MLKTDLSSYNNSWYIPGSFLKRSLWYICSPLFFRNSFFPFYSLKRAILRSFGSKIGKGVVIKPKVNIKYPWLLTIGDHSWVGENVWIDNLAQVTIGANVCLSQGSMLLCGNHDYKRTTFDLWVKPIKIADGVWIGAQALVCPGVNCRSHAVLSVKSVAVKDLDEYTIYVGNPAIAIKMRQIEE